MQLETLEIPEAEAREKLAEYEAQLLHERSAEDEAIAMGYRAAARGLPVIRLSTTIAAGGWHANGLPRMAIAPADAVDCYVRWDGDDLVFASYDSWQANRGALVGRHSVRVPVAEPPQVRSGRYWRAARTLVPLIPPRHRPRRRSLPHRHILWEVAEWKRVPPKDPALLRHIRGDLWAVLAVWDLTDLERYVLSQR